MPKFIMLPPWAILFFSAIAHLAKPKSLRLIIWSKFLKCSSKYMDCFSRNNSFSVKMTLKMDIHVSTAQVFKNFSSLPLILTPPPENGKLYFCSSCASSDFFGDGL